jgi:SAM-dependent methyltransferase
MSALQPTRVLSVGCGFGDELDHLLANVNVENPSFRVTAVDIVDVGSHVLSQRFAARLGTRLTWRRYDLNSVWQLGEFDVVQCGFVLHDVPSSGKLQALESLARAVAPGGYLIISDFFLHHMNDIPGQKLAAYNLIIEEAVQALDSGDLNQLELQELLGDGVGPGLLATRAHAVLEERDFFDTVPLLMERASHFGFHLVQIHRNQFHEWLAVLVMQRPAQESHNLER